MRKGTAASNQGQTNRAEVGGCVTDMGSRSADDELRTSGDPAMDLGISNESLRRGVIQAEIDRGDSSV